MPRGCEKKHRGARHDFTEDLELQNATGIEDLAVPATIATSVGSQVASGA
jgi:hypothetical protein